MVACVQNMLASTPRTARPHHQVTWKPTNALDSSLTSQSALHTASAIVVSARRFNNHTATKPWATHATNSSSVDQTREATRLNERLKASNASPVSTAAAAIINGHSTGRIN